MLAKLLLGIMAGAAEAPLQLHSRSFYYCLYDQHDKHVQNG
jgi:hypothetical protein